MNDDSSSLDRFNIILANTRHAGNIGATARVMKNFGLSKLTLVNPTSRGHMEAVKMAVGAEEIVERCRVTKSLEEAIADCVSVFAVSRRSWKIKKDVFTPNEAASRMRIIPGETGVVFGSEKLGLSGHEMGLCGAVIHIPTTDEHPSLNLAQAVAIVSYEIAKHNVTPGAITPRDDEKTSMTDRAILRDRMTKALSSVGYLGKGNADEVIRRLDAIFDRAELDAKETRILLGMFREILRATSGRT